jgi:hypothetical protein
MDLRDHARVPAGTLMDLQSGQPVTVFRDDARAYFPAMELDLTEARRLMNEVLPVLCRAMAAAGAEEKAAACNCVISGGNVLPASCAGPHGIPCEICGGVEPCADNCGETPATVAAS